MLDNPFEDEGLTYNERKTKLKEIFDELQKRLSVKNLELIKEMLTISGLDAATIKSIVIDPKKIEFNDLIQALYKDLHSSWVEMSDLEKIKEKVLKLLKKTNNNPLYSSERREAINLYNTLALGTTNKP